MVTSEQYVGIVQQQLPEIPLDNILAEPEARNTAPCIAYACWKIKCRFPNANIVVTPSDALVIDVIGFRKVIAQALSFTQERKAIDDRSQTFKTRNWIWIYKNIFFLYKE